MASIKTSRGKFCYKPKFVYLGIKRINPVIAFENLKDLVNILNNYGILATPAFGTLLGIIRENDFIAWDEDIDLFILKEDKEKLLDAFWDMRKEGFELIRNARVGHLYSIMRNGEYIDFYIMEPISPEVRTTLGGGYILEKYLTDLMDWDFKGLTVKVPKEHEQCLAFMYGNWRTPVQYADFEQSRINILKLRFAEMLKELLPSKLHLALLRIYHKGDLNKFLSKCEKEGVVLNYPIK